jgi:hypothetical protein
LLKLTVVKALLSGEILLKCYTFVI